MTAIDRAKVIEAATRAIALNSGPMGTHYFDVAQGAAAAVLPVIAAGLLAPLRELHHAKAYTCTHLRTPGELGPCCRHEICATCNQMHPCSTVRLLDLIEADAKGDER